MERPETIPRCIHRTGQKRRKDRRLRTSFPSDLHTKEEEGHLGESAERAERVVRATESRGCGCG